MFFVFQGKMKIKGRACTLKTRERGKMKRWIPAKKKIKVVQKRELLIRHVNREIFRGEG